MAAKWEAELREGRYRRVTKITWEEFRLRHEAEAQASLKPETCKKYGSTFNHVERILNPTSPSKLTTETVSSFVASLQSEGLRPGTVGLYCRHLRAAMNWAAEIGFIAKAPKVRSPKSDDTSRLMKGRAIVAEEHERILAAVGSLIPANHVDAWEHFLTGLWWSGLRLSEALRLSWDASEDVSVVIISDRAAFQFRASGQKARRADIVPCAPEFSKMLTQTPKGQRRGRVFRLDRFDGSGPLSADRVGKLIGKMAKTAGVVVDASTGKYASAHDYRRAFGTRWAKRLKIAQLRCLMRHKDIATTLKFYVDQEADDVNSDLWDAYEKSGNTLGNSTPEKHVFPEV